MTPEGKIKLKVKLLLTLHEAYFHCVVQNGMGAPSLDFVGCHKGLYYSVETKAGNKQPTPRQELTIKEMRKAGAKVFVVTEVSGFEELERWLKEVQHEAKKHGGGNSSGA